MRLRPPRGGAYRIIRVDGNETVVPHKKRPYYLQKEVHQAIDCEVFDVLLLDREKGVVLLSDKNAEDRGKPVNETASKLLSETFGRPYVIRGDVVVADDKDFG